MHGCFLTLELSVRAQTTAYQQPASQGADQQNTLTYAVLERDHTDFGFGGLITVRTTNPV